MLSLLDFKRERINKMRQSLIQSERSKAGADLLFVKGAVLHLTDRQLIPLRLLKLPVCVFCVCLWLIRVHTLACCKRKTFLSGNFFLFFFLELHIILFHFASHFSLRLPSSHPNRKTRRLLPGIPSPGNPLCTARYLREKTDSVRGQRKLGFSGHAFQLFRISKSSEPTRKQITGPKVSFNHY